MSIWVYTLKPYTQAVRHTTEEGCKFMYKSSKSSGHLWNTQNFVRTNIFVSCLYHTNSHHGLESKLRACALSSVKASGTKQTQLTNFFKPCSQVRFLNCYFNYSPLVTKQHDSVHAHFLRLFWLEKHNNIEKLSNFDLHHVSSDIIREN